MHRNKLSERNEVRLESSAWKNVISFLFGDDSSWTTFYTFTHVRLRKKLQAGKDPENIRRIYDNNNRRFDCVFSIDPQVYVIEKNRSMRTFVAEMQRLILETCSNSETLKGFLKCSHILERHVGRFGSLVYTDKITNAILETEWKLAKLD